MSRSTLKKHKHNNSNKPKKQLKHVNLKQNKHTIRARGLKTKPMAGGSLKRNKIKQLGGECSPTQFIIKTAPNGYVIYDIRLTNGVPTAQYIVTMRPLDCDKLTELLNPNDPNRPPNTVELQVYKTDDKNEGDALKKWFTEQMNNDLNKNKFILRYKTDGKNGSQHYICFIHNDIFNSFSLPLSENNKIIVLLPKLNGFSVKLPQGFSPYVGSIFQDNDQPLYDNATFGVPARQLTTSASTNTLRPPPEVPPLRPAPSPPVRLSLAQPPPPHIYETPVAQYVAPVPRGPPQLYNQPGNVPLYTNPLYEKENPYVIESAPSCQLKSNIYNALLQLAYGYKTYKAHKKSLDWYKNKNSVLILLQNPADKEGKQLYFKVVGSGDSIAPKIYFDTNITYSDLLEKMKKYTNNYSFVVNLGGALKQSKLIDYTTFIANLQAICYKAQTQTQKAGGGSAHVDHSSVYGTVGSKNPNTTTKSRRQHKLVTTRRRTIKKHN